MAKQDRRAGQDEAIQAVAPVEAPRVSNVPVENLRPLMNAEYQRAGLWLNPDIFNDLAAVSDTIHNTRRHSRNVEFNVALKQRELDQQRLLIDQERITQFRQDKEVADFMYSYEADMLTALEEAKRNGTPSIDAINAVDMQYDKREENLYGRSPYMGQQFSNFRKDYIKNSIRSGINNDMYMAQELAKQEFNRAAGIGISNMINGQYNFDQYLEEMPKKLWGVMDSLTNPEEVDLMNRNYNAGFLADMRMMEARVKSGLTTPEKAKEYYLASLYKYRSYDFVGQDREGDTHTIHAYLTDDTIKTVQAMASDSNQNRNTANAVYTAESWLQMVGAEDAKKGEYDKIAYYKNTSPAKAREDWMAARAQLIMEMGAGNESARKQLWEIDNHYWTVVYPQITFRDLMRKSLATYGNLDMALKDISSRLLSVENKLISGDSLENITDLSWTDGTTYLNLGYPAPGTDPQFDDFLRRSGVTPYNARYNYYNTMIIEGKKFIEAARNTDLVAAMNPGYASSLNELNNALSYENLVREDLNTGSIVINESALQEAAETAKKSRMALVGASGTTIVNNTSRTLLDSLVDKSKKLNTNQKAVFFQAAARVFTMSGMTDAFTAYKLDGLNNEQKQVAMNIAMWSFLSSTPELRGYANKILTNQIGGAEPNPTMNDANTLLKGKVKHSKEATFADDVERKLNDYNIPAKYRPALRFLFANMGVAAIAGDTEDKLAFDMNAVENTLNANFTKNGTYKFSAALGNTTAEEADQRISDAKAMIEGGMKNLGMKGQITAQIDDDTGLIKFYSDGQPFMATGTYAPLRGSGRVPFGISTDGKPAGMPTQKFNDAQATLIAGATINMALSNADINAKVQDILEKTGMSPDTAKQFSYRFMNTINDTKFQEDWYNYYNSNYTNTRVQAAPDEVKKVLVDSLQEFNVLLNARTYNRVNTDQLNHFVDFVYTRSQSGNTVRLDVPPSAHFETTGFPYLSIEESARAAGMTVTSTTGGKHTPGSRHPYGEASDFGYSGGFLAQAMYPGTDRLNTDKLDSFLNNVVLPQDKVGNVKTILTSYPYLLSDEAIAKAKKDGYNVVPDKDPRYAKYRNMKTKQGRSLFEYYPGHLDHYHVSWNKVMYDTKTGKEYTGQRNEQIRTMAHIIETNINDRGAFGFINGNESKAMASMFYNYKPTEWDAKNTGRSISELTDSPVTRAIAAAAKYQRGKNALGSSNLAIMGMMGASFKMISSESGIKSPTEIFTLEQVIDQASRIGSGRQNTTTIRWVIADKDLGKYNKIVNQFVKAGR